MATEMNSKVNIAAADTIITKVNESEPNSNTDSTAADTPTTKTSESEPDSKTDITTADTLTTDNESEAKINEGVTAADTLNTNANESASNADPQAKPKIEFVFDTQGYDCHRFICHVCDIMHDVSVSFGKDEDCPICGHEGCRLCSQYESLPCGILGVE